MAKEKVLPHDLGRTDVGANAGHGASLLEKVNSRRRLTIVRDSLLVDLTHS